MSGERTVDRAADAIREAILSGAMAPGSRLDPERKLAADFGISRLTLRSAIARLESEGLLRPVQGQGITVLDYTRTGGIGLLVPLLAAGRTELVEPFLSLRRTLAAQAIAQACERATDNEVADLQTLARSAATAPNRKELLELNLAFARQIVVLARNLPMLLLFNTVLDVFRDQPRLMDALAADEPAVRASFGAIAALVAARDPARASAVVLEVLAAIDHLTLNALEAP